MVDAPLGRALLYRVVQQTEDSRIHWLAVVGPTAVGKSAAAIAIATAIGGEIVNADASQFYRGMDIGTAKVTSAERARVPHHLLDCLEIGEVPTVAWFQESAREVGEQIRSRGKLPILVGGSGLYVRACLDVLELPGTDPQVRDELTAWADRVGPERAYAELQCADPVAAEAIAPANTRRVVRALEVMRITGRPFSATMPTRTYERPTRVLGLRAERSGLVDRITARVDAMMDAGLESETRELWNRGLADTQTAKKSLGYAQILPYLPGPVPREQVAGEISLATRRFAKRQMTWFRADPRIDWIDVDFTRTDEALQQAQSWARTVVS